MIRNKEQQGVTNVQSNYEEMIVKQASDSPEINQLILFYKDAGICDINCTIFGEQILIDIKKVIINTLQLGIMICEEDYDKFEKMQNLLFRLCVEKLDEVYHLTYDVEHNVIISVICNSLGLNRSILTNSPKLSIVFKDGPNDRTTIEFNLKSDTNENIKFDPLQQINTICGMMSVFKPDFEYVIDEVKNVCNCSKNFLRTNQEMEYRIRGPISFTEGEIGQIETFFQKREKFLQVHYAIEKYSWTIRRDSSLDKMLFIVFSLELLFGKGESIDSIQYKLMIRVINFLSKDKLIRKKIGQKIKNIYDARSKMVHGFEKEADRKIIDLCIKNISSYQELLRILILNTIIKSHEYVNHKMMLEEIDYNISRLEEVNINHINWLD